MLLVDDKNGNVVQGFAPTSGKTYQGEVTVNTPTAIKLGADVTITIDGKSVDYDEGFGLILIPNTTYIFSNNVDCHVME